MISINTSMARALDLTGHRYGRLEVLERDGSTKHGAAKWRVRCTCGTVKSVPGGAMRSGLIRSCGCLKEVSNSVRNARHAIDMRGQRFGRLRVVRREGSTKAGKPTWLVVCECGTRKVVVGASLCNGVTKSCGCLHREVVRESGKAIKHGHKRGGVPSVEYQAWRGMISRCENQDHKDYPNWGGRGITVCVQWRESFETFLQDMGPKPLDKDALDRIDNDGNYVPGNVRWATWSQSNLNRRKPKAKQALATARALDKDQP